MSGARESFRCVCTAVESMARESVESESAAIESRIADNESASASSDADTESGEDASASPGALRGDADCCAALVRTMQSPTAISVYKSNRLKITFFVELPESGFGVQI